MRLIDADALIANKFKNAISYNAFVNLVKRQETVEPERQWIPCSERLPGEGTNVILSDDLNVTIGRLIHYTDIGYKWEIDHWDNDFEDWQAWMPSPEPYGEIKKADKPGEK